MVITLSGDLERRIAEQVKSGRFSSPEAVIEAAVVEFTETPFDDSLNAEDRVAIQEAEAEIDRGEGIEWARFKSELGRRFAQP
jgi:Arc/MetJ-type ribon-helix-helix transcriptional regulator